MKVSLGKNLTLTHRYHNERLDLVGLPLLARRFRENGVGPGETVGEALGLGLILGVLHLILLLVSFRARAGPQSEHDAANHRQPFAVVLFQSKDQLHGLPVSKKDRSLSH